MDVARQGINLPVERSSPVQLSRRRRMRGNEDDRTVSRSTKSQPSGRGKRKISDFTPLPPPDVEEAWRDCLSRVEAPAHYNCPEFFKEPVWIGKRPFAVLALDRGSVIGVLTGLNEGAQVLSGLQSRPQICLDTTAEATAALSGLARGLLNEARSAKLVTAYTWSSLPLDAFKAYGFRCRELEGNIVLDLTKGPAALFKEFHASRRKNIRYAMKNGVVISQAETPEDVESFYQNHLKWRQTTRKKIWTPEISREVFEQRFRHPESFRFILARYSGKVIANIILRFCSRGLIEFSNHSSLDEYLHLKPNDLLQWKGIEWACNQGFRSCSLGGAHTFHRRFGGTLVSIIRYRVDRTWLHRYDFQEGTMDRARASFRMLPDRVQKVFRRILDKPEQAP